MTMEGAPPHKGADGPAGGVDTSTIGWNSDLTVTSTVMEGKGPGE